MITTIDLFLTPCLHQRVQTSCSKQDSDFYNNNNNNIIIIIVFISNMWSHIVQPSSSGALVCSEDLKEETYHFDRLHPTTKN